jgi:hypothetical protein
MPTPESPAPWRRLRISVAETMGLVALVAVALAEPGLMPTACLIAGLRLAAALGSPRARGRLGSLAVVLAAVYVPTSLGFFLSPPSPLRERWSSNFAIAPGSPPALLVQRFILDRFVTNPDLSGALFFAIGSFVTTSLVLVLLLLAGRSPTRRAVAAALGFAVSLASSWVLFEALAT